MQLTSMNSTIRSAALSGSRSSCWSAPIACSGSSTTTTSSAPSAPGRRTPQKPHSLVYSRCNYQQKRSISTKQPIRQVVIRQHAASRQGHTTALRTPASHSITSSQMASLSTDSASSTSSASSSDQKSSPNPSEVLLDWNTFFNLRASRRRYSLVSSIIASLGTTSTGLTILATQNLETIGAQLMGLDPIAVMVLGTAACSSVGWLAGPFLGNSVWRLVHRKYKGAFAVKDKAFYDRIKRFRVDPSAQSFSNPVPDYYGEKIGSVQGYRQWLKDQRAYNRKKRSFV